MPVDPIRAGQIAEVYRRSVAPAGEAKRSEAQDAGPPAGRSDSVTLSESAATMQRARRAAKAAAEVRAALVEDLRQQVANGTYVVDPDALARSLLEKLLRSA